MQKRCLSDLTIKNDFMFGAVMITVKSFWREHWK